MFTSPETGLYSIYDYLCCGGQHGRAVSSDPSLPCPFRLDQSTAGTGSQSKDVPFMSRLLLSLSAVTLGLAVVSSAHSTPTQIATSRFQTSINNAAIHHRVITAEQIKASNTTTLSQLLALQGGIYIRDLYGITGTQSSADMGGFGTAASHNVLLLLNGRRINDIGPNSANLATLPLNSIARIEIIQGSAAVLYGDNATAGAINIVTQNGFGQPRTRINASTGSYKTQQLGISHSQSLGSGSDLYIAATGLRSDGYRADNDFDQKSITAELNRSDLEFDYGFRFNGNYEDQTLPGALSESTFWQDPRAATSQREQASQNRNAAEVYLVADRYAGELSVSHKRLESDLNGTIESDLSSWSATPRLTLAGGGHDVIAGLDVYYSAVDSFTNTGPTSANSSLTSRTSYALYATDSYALGSRTNLSAGLRQQWANLGIDNSNLTTLAATNQSQKERVSAWNMGVNHRFSSDIQGYIRWAESFRFPVLEEMWDGNDGSISLLIPQTGHHIELGSTVAIDWQSQLEIHLFQMRLNNEIVYDPTTNQHSNYSDDTRHRGLNLNLRHQLTPGWLANLGYGWRAASYDAGNRAGKTPPDVAKHILSLRNMVEINDHSNINADLLYTGKRYFSGDVDNNARQMPSHAQINLSYHYQLARWSARFSINNLTDKAVVDAGSYNPVDSSIGYYPLPGRSYTLTAGTEF